MMGANAQLWGSVPICDQSIKREGGREITVFTLYCSIVVGSLKRQTDVMGNEGEPEMGMVE